MSQHVAQLPKEKAADIGEFLTNNVSRAVVYALMHRQPMTRREIEKSPLTNSMRRMSLSAQTRQLKDKSSIQMRTLLAKGVECGMLVPLTSKRQNYYFLNSDLRIEPAPIRESAEDEEDVSLKVFADRSFAHAPGHAVLPSWGTAADATVLPVPYIESPKSLVIWLSWMMTKTRRQILSYINEQGPTKRPKLRADLGFWADRIVAKEGLPSNVLERVDGRIRYQFSTFSFSKLKVKAETEGKRRSWTSFPPSFWLTRTYEPLRCISGASKYLDQGKPQKTPIAILEELAEGSPTINDRSRKDFLEINFLERMSFYAVYHSGSGEATKISSETLVPEKVTFNSPEHPLVWISTTDEEHASARVDFKHEAAMMLQSKKTKEEQVEFLEDMLKRIAKERIGVRLQEHERLLTKDLDRLRVESYGLGSSSISAVADLELDRESLALEKKYFEKFMDILVPGAIERPSTADDETADQKSDD